jgi:hypothetical protein
MKKSEIAAKVFDTLDPLPLADVADGPLSVSVADLAALSLVPWFCDASVQWALRLTLPGSPLKKTLLKKVNGSFVSEQNGAVLVGVPGDGIEPSIYTLTPLAEAVAKVITPGMTLELAAANVGMVKRDWEVKAETNTTHGNQRYVGSVSASGTWAIARSTPALTRAQLETAVACGRMVVQKGPWTVQDKAEAEAILVHWLQSREANVAPPAVKRFIVLKDGAFVNTDPGMDRKLCGLGLGFFRERLKGGPFRWAQSDSSWNSPQLLQDVIKTVVG